MPRGQSLRPCTIARRIGQQILGTSPRMTDQVEVSTGMQCWMQMRGL